MYVDPSRRQTFIELIQNQGGAVQGFESQVYRKDGSTIWISENARALYDEQGNLAGFEGTVEDITHRKRDREMIEYMAYYDILTELPNRMLFNDRVTMSLAQAARNSDELVAVVFLDLDRFKLINDSLGHSIGDRLLQNVAQLLRTVLRTGDTVSRWGGDEFTLLLPHLHRLEELEGLLERLIATMASGFECDGQLLHVTCSLGVAIYPWDGHDGATLLKNADAALYRAKELGRNTYQFYAPAMNAHASARLALENDLRLALSRGELEVYFQPQVEIATGKIVGAETLLRWHHHEHGLMSPTEFIPLAEETGLIIPIGEWVLERSCAYAALWQQQGLPEFRIAVNLSPKQFQQPDLVARIEAVLQTTQLSAQTLELEITESTAMQDIERTRSILDALGHLGIAIAIDDF
ncbi:MAG: diguanylate cyclase, partial [Synechococcaceae cyanobacterium SM2_3_60]|nr:diguanylate cyclase [Synechococcaceae cyanobacterium SM2_3_60]